LTWDPASVAAGCDDPAGDDRTWPDGAPGVCHSSAVDLYAWIAEDLTGVRRRFETGVVERIPLDRWGERVGGGARPSGCIASLLLHMTVHHDVAIRGAVRGLEPLFTTHRALMGLPGASPAVALPERDDPELTSRLDPAALDAYAVAVHEDTVGWLTTAPPLADVPPSGDRLTEHAGIPDGELPWLRDMWTGRSVGWFLQWEVIGHGYTHVGEMVGIRGQLGLSPF
jgi:hypothetical protein